MNLRHAYFSFGGRASRRFYVICFLIPVGLLFVAAKFADEASCKSTPLLQDGKANTEQTEAERELSTGALSAVQSFIRRKCERNWLIQTGPKRGSFQLNIGFEYSNGYLSGTPFQSLALLLLIWPYAAVSVKRFHDRGMSGWWVLGFPLLTIGLAYVLLAYGLDYKHGSVKFLGWIALGLISLLQIVSFTILAILPGQKGDNGFGSDPRELQSA